MEGKDGCFAKQRSIPTYQFAVLSYSFLISTMLYSIHIGSEAIQGCLPFEDRMGGAPIVVKRSRSLMI